MAMDKAPLPSEAETRRCQQLRDRLAQEHRALAHTKLLDKIFSQVRVIFLFLLGAAIVTFIVAHQNQIDSLAAQKISHAVKRVQTKSASDPLRQSALNYEKEVDAAAE
jgi:hypothetical protein